MKKYTINPDITYKQVAETVIILDEDQAQIRELNDVASFIFLSLKKWSSLEEVATKLTEEYDVSKNEALSDIKEFVTMYVQHGFVVSK